MSPSILLRLSQSLPQMFSPVVVTQRGLKKLGHAKFISAGRYRHRKGYPYNVTAETALAEDPDWSYPDGTPGSMTKGQSERYLRDQEFGKTMVKFLNQFEKIKNKRSAESDS